MFPPPDGDVELFLFFLKEQLTNEMSLQTSASTWSNISGFLCKTDDHRQGLWLHFYLSMKDFFNSQMSLKQYSDSFYSSGIFLMLQLLPSVVRLSSQESEGGMLASAKTDHWFPSLICVHLSLSPGKINSEGIQFPTMTYITRQFSIYKCTLIKTMVASFLLAVLLNLSGWDYSAGKTLVFRQFVGEMRQRSDTRGGLCWSWLQEVNFLSFLEVNWWSVTLSVC